jgi:type II secretory pathway pseudopilin PulG
MKMILRGFTLFETILYLAIFSILSMALLAFSWNMSDLETKEQVSRQVFSDTRFVTERLTYLIRSASSVDTGASVFDDADGQLVLEYPGTSDTTTIDIRSGRVTLIETGSDPVTLHASSDVVSELRFEHDGSSSDGSEYVGFIITLQSEQLASGQSRAPYEASTTMHSGAFLRNQSL